MAGKNRKKITYRQLMNYVLIFEHKVNMSLNTIGRTIAQYIEFTGQQQDFMNWLKEKHEGEKSAREKSENKKESK